jgi:lysophospholipase L1-like esterase
VRVFRRPRGVLWAVLAVAAVVASASVPADAAPAAYAALGDSYTSGPLIPTQLFDPFGCLRSDHDYPHLAAQALGMSLHDVSCSGAGTRELSVPQAVQGGPNPPQLDALDPSTRLVTLQIGGNDIGFTDIIRSCIAVVPLGSPCQDHYTAGGPDQLSGRIAATAPRVAAALAEIHRRAPDARVLVVGYPAILPEAGVGCWPMLPLAWADVAWLRGKEKELDGMLASVAASGGATYVDTYAPSVGHDACELPGVRWVEPLAPVAAAAPVHPNAIGMQAMAALVVSAGTR